MIIQTAAEYMYIYIWIFVHQEDVQSQGVNIQFNPLLGYVLIFVIIILLFILC
jgi:hypothetical protein